MRKKTQEEFFAQVKEITDDEYVVLGKYINTSTKILMRHKKCNYEYSVMPDNFLRGSRCPKCSRRLKKTTEVFKQEVEDRVGDEYTVLGEYKHANHKILMRHNTCGREYEIVPNDFLRGNRCAVCMLEANASRRRKTTEQFVSEVRDLVGDEYTVLGEYKNRNTKILMRHNTCGFQFNATPHNFLRGSRCPRSKGELAIEKILREHNIAHKPEFRFPHSRYKYDFAVFDQTEDDNAPILLIEFDGVQHFEPVKMFGGIEGLKGTQKRDKKKNLLAKKNNVSLLRIRYDQFDLKTEDGIKSLEELILENLTSQR